MMYDRVMQAAQMTGAYDMVKTTDMLLDIHDVNPEDLKPDETIEQQFEDSRVSKSLELANVENGMMLEGQALPPTPFAPSQHTEVHIAAIGSPEFMEMEAEDERLKNLTAHIMGEMQEQEQRKQSVAGVEGAGAQEEGFEYKPPSSPSATNLSGGQPQKQTVGNQAIPQMAQTQQTANVLGGAF